MTRVAGDYLGLCSARYLGFGHKAVGRLAGPAGTSGVIGWEALGIEAHSVHLKSWRIFLVRIFQDYSYTSGSPGRRGIKTNLVEYGLGTEGISGLTRMKILVGHRCLSLPLPWHLGESQSYVNNPAVFLKIC